MKSLALSVVIITHNEEANIERAIKSALPLSNDVIIVDSGSTDNTVKIAENLGAKVFVKEWQGYSKQKNFGNSLTLNNYIFSIDADEAISPELQDELNSLFNKGNLKTMYRVNRLNHYCGKPIRHGSWYPDWHIRLFDKRALNWIETDDVHEEMNRTRETTSEDLKGHLLHFTTQSEDFYVQKMEVYAKLFAGKMHAKGKSAGYLKACSSAIFRFFKEYILQRGFIDGSAGFIIARAHFFYTLKKYIYLRNYK